MLCEQHHGFNKSLDVEELGRVVGIREAHLVGELGAAVLDLDSSVHFHEEVIEAYLGRGAAEETKKKHDSQMKSE